MRRIGHSYSSGGGGDGVVRQAVVDGSGACVNDTKGDGSGGA